MLPLDAIGIFIKNNVKKLQRQINVYIYLNLYINFKPLRYLSLFRDLKAYMYWQKVNDTNVTHQILLVDSVYNFTGA